jgi:hypothetical protein
VPRLGLLYLLTLTDRGEANLRRSPSFRSTASLAGVASVVLANVAARFGNAGGGVPSPFEAPAREIAAYYADYSTFTSVSAYLYGLSAVGLVVFAVAVWDRLCNPGPAEARSWALVGMVGTAGYAVLLLLLALLQLALAGLTLRDAASSQVFAGLAVLWATAAVMLVPGSVALLLGFGMAARRSGAFSGLLSNLALLGAALGVVPPPEVLGPVSPVLGSLSFVLSELQPWMLVLWALGTAWVLRRTDVAGREEQQLSTGEAGG